MTKEDSTSLIANKDFSEVLKDNITLYAKETFDRAFPDVKDFLKPVARRALYTMWEQKLTYFKKLAYTTGLCMGYYHPHADNSINDCIVLLSQDFRVNYPLFTAQGNNGSVEGDPAAAGRYLEMKLSKFAQDCITDEIDSYSIDYQPNYDDTRLEPSYLPSKVPLCLLMGPSGIGEAFTVDIPPHNLTDVANLVIKYISNKNISLKELVKGFYPDFPTGGIIINKSIIDEYYSMESEEINEALKNKRTFTVKYIAKTDFDKENNIILIKNIPYGTTFDKIKEKIIDEVLNKGNVILSNIINTGNRKVGNEIWFELICKKDSNLLEILNNLYEKTPMSNYTSLSFMINYGQAIKRLSIKDIVSLWYKQRVKTKRRKFNYEHSNYQNKVHVLHGIRLIHDKKSEVINLIMKCSDKEEAIKELCNKFGLSLVQARGICEAEIGFLTRVNSTKLDSDIKKYENIIADYDYKLSHIDEVIIEEIRELEKKYKRDRKTEITDNINENNKKTSIHISNGVLLYNKDSVGIFDSSAILNSKIILNTMRSYKIDGKWKKEIIFYQPVHKDLYGIIVFYNNGLAKRIKMSDIPLINTWIPILEASLINPISTIVPIYEDENLEIVTVSSDGKIKRFLASDISTNMKVNVGNVIAALSLREYDEIVILYNNKGEYLCIEKDDIPLLSRNAQGNKTGFDGSDQLYLTTLKEHNDMIGIMYSDDSSGYIYGLRESELKYGSRTNKPKPFLNIKLKNLKFNGIFPLTTESKNDTSIVFIGNMVLTTVKTRLIKFDESRKIGIAAFGGVQITH